MDLLSREGEIAIAKRIEAGREAMIAGLCESPLTFQAIIIWRDELNEARSSCATSSTSKRPTPAPTPRTCRRRDWPRRPVGRVPRRQAPGGRRRRGARHWPADRRRPDVDADAGEEAIRRPGEGDLDDDDMEISLSLAAIEAELKPKVIETFDKIADTYKRLRRLQDQDIQFQLKSDDAVARAGAQVQEAQGRDHRRGEVAAAEPGPHRRLVEQLYDINKRLIGYEGRLMRLPKATASRARTS